MGSFYFNKNNSLQAGERGFELQVMYQKEAHSLLIWNQIMKELKEFNRIFGSPKVQNFEPALKTAN